MLIFWTCSLAWDLAAGLHITLKVLENVELFVVGETRGRTLRGLPIPGLAHLGLFSTGPFIGVCRRLALFVVRVEVGHAVQILLGLYDVQSLVLGGVGAAHSRLLARHRQIHTYNYYRLTVSDLIEPRGALRMSAPQNDKFM